MPRWIRLFYLALIDWKSTSSWNVLIFVRPREKDLHICAVDVMYFAREASFWFLNCPEDFSFKFEILQTVYEVRPSFYFYSQKNSRPTSLFITLFILLFLLLTYASYLRDSSCYLRSIYSKLINTLIKINCLYIKQTSICTGFLTNNHQAV